MNNRILELALKAGLTGYFAANRPDLATPMPISHEEQKFAELIIADICDILKQAQDDCIHENAADTNWGYISILEDWVERFNEHFGIK